MRFGQFAIDFGRERARFGRSDLAHGLFFAHVSFRGSARSCVGSNPMAYPACVLHSTHSIVYRALGAFLSIASPPECPSFAWFSLIQPPRAGTPGWLFTFYPLQTPPFSNKPPWGGSVGVAFNFVPAFVNFSHLERAPGWLIDRKVPALYPLPFTRTPPRSGTRRVGGSVGVAF